MLSCVTGELGMFRDAERLAAISDLGGGRHVGHATGA